MEIEMPKRKSILVASAVISIFICVMNNNNTAHATSCAESNGFFIPPSGSKMTVGTAIYYFLPSDKDAPRFSASRENVLVDYDLVNSNRQYSVYKLKLRGKLGKSIQVVANIESNRGNKTVKAMYQIDKNKRVETTRSFKVKNIITYRNYGMGIETNEHSFGIEGNATLVLVRWTYRAKKFVEGKFDGFIILPVEKRGSFFWNMMLENMRRKRTGKTIIDEKDYVGRISLGEHGCLGSSLYWNDIPIYVELSPVCIRKACKKEASVKLMLPPPNHIVLSKDGKYQWMYPRNLQ